MKLKLKAVELNTHETTTGSCELCMSIETINEPVFIFEDEKGNEHRVGAYNWAWGHYDEIIVDNVIDFADYVRKQDIPKGTDIDYTLVHDLIWAYDDNEPYVAD